jgi:hypothetical protein
VEFNPKSARAGGDVVFKSQGGYKIFVSWGDLKKVEKLNGVDGHADFSIKRMKGSGEARVKDMRRESRTVGGHRASYNEVKLELVRRGLYFNKSLTPQEVRSLHVHCDVTSRYFVLYGPYPPDRSREQREAMDRMSINFVCH